MVNCNRHRTMRQRQFGTNFGLVIAWQRMLSTCVSHTSNATLQACQDRVGLVPTARGGGLRFRIVPVPVNPELGQYYIVSAEQPVGCANYLTVPVCFNPSVDASLAYRYGDDNGKLNDSELSRLLHSRFLVVLLPFGVNLSHCLPAFANASHLLPSASFRSPMPARARKAMPALRLAPL